MCGIVGYLGSQNAIKVIIEGLSRLEYRGYDSAGLALVNKDNFIVYRTEGKLNNLKSKLSIGNIYANLGIGHTRWATHGRPSEVNAHPHLAGNVAVVHNGIIENYLELKSELLAAGHNFSSETDTEIISHLVEELLKQGCSIEKAIRQAISRIRGSYALVFLHCQFPNLMIGVRKNAPLIMGLGSNNNQKEFFLASDIPAFLQHTNQVIFLKDGDIIVIKDNSYSITDISGYPQNRYLDTINWSPVMVEKTGYSHFMQKEIFEQPRAIIDTLANRVRLDSEEISFPELNNIIEILKNANRLILLGCGTSYHSGLVGKFLFESLCKISTDVDLSSEFRYRDPLVRPNDIIIAVSQSGETADTLAAVREAKSKGAQILTICNVKESSLTRESVGTIYTYAGPEIGVASTKAFTSQLVVLQMLALYLAWLRGRIDKKRLASLISELVILPALIQQSFGFKNQIKAVAKKFYQSKDFLYLGRGICYPIALEGALKLKEISYIHAEGYPAGEMKHGPIALIDNKIPIVVLANRSAILEKNISTIQEIRARGGQIIAVTEDDNKIIRSLADAILPVPAISSFLSAVLLTIPLQLLAYYIAILKGLDVDQPRNLAKSVTVE